MKGPHGAPLRSRSEDNNLQIIQNFDAVLEMTGAEAPDIAASGNAMVKALSRGYAQAKNKVRAGI
jgi:hypothetical protein